LQRTLGDLGTVLPYQHCGTVERPASGWYVELAAGGEAFLGTQAALAHQLIIKLIAGAEQRGTPRETPGASSGPRIAQGPRREPSRSTETERGRSQRPHRPKPGSRRRPGGRPRKWSPSPAEEDFMRERASLSHAQLAIAMNARFGLSLKRHDVVHHRQRHLRQRAAA
jgi:hypothetical protein